MGKVKQAIVVLIIAVSIYKVLKLFESRLPPIVEGNFHPDFRKVAETFRKLVEDGAEKGGSVAVYHEGELVVDLWGGYGDLESERRWRADTITLVFSCTKAVTAILAAKLADQGYLDYKKKVSHYWPGFGQNGKENITVEMLLSHQAGLVTTNESIPIHWINYEPERLERFLEEQKPMVEPGTGIVYHSVTFGLYVDRLLPKIDPKHRSVPQMFKEEIAKPYDIDFTMGLDVSQEYRFVCCTLLDLKYLLLSWLSMPWYWDLLWSYHKPNSLAMASTTAVRETSKIAYLKNPEIRQHHLSSAMGHGNAKSLAKLFSLIANGLSSKGTQLLSSNTTKLLTTPVISENSLDFGRMYTFGLGVAFYKNPLGGRVFGHSGYGGQMTYGDMENNLSFSYITNHLGVYSWNDDPKYLALEKATYECLEQYKKRKTRTH